MQILKRREFLIVLLAITLIAGQEPIPATGPAPAIRVTTRMVVVDVIASKDGKQVTDLKADDFTIQENGKTQRIEGFSFEAGPGTMASSNALPPNVYSNRPEYNASAGPLTVLLLDALNTPWSDQAYVRHEMLRYVASQLQPKQQVAVYTLASRLSKLQDFTSDPVLLRDAILRYVPVPQPANVQTITGQNAETPRGLRAQALEGSGKQARVVGNGNVSGGNSTLEAGIVTSLQSFEQEQIATQLEARIDSTLGAMRLLSVSLAGYPGRKNLVWISAGFPFSLYPETMATPVAVRADPTGPPPLQQEMHTTAYASQVQQGFDEDIRRASWLMSEAQVSIYPVDARGLVNTGLTGPDVVVRGPLNANALILGSGALQSSQASMEDFARQTGGKVFKNRNDIDRGVALASQDGGSYYQLAYYPSKRTFDGGFRKIKVEVKRSGIVLRYRDGYYAMDSGKSPGKARDMETAQLLSTSAANANMVVFDARVVPPAPASKMQVPVQFRVDPNSISAEDAGGGRKHLNLNFYVTALSPDGKMHGVFGKTVDATLEAAQYEQMEKMGGLLVPVEVPLTPGDYVLRLAVRDNRTGLMGSLGVPLSLGKPRS